MKTITVIETVEEFLEAMKGDEPLITNVEFYNGQESLCLRYDTRENVRVSMLHDYLRHRLLTKVLTPLNIGYDSE